MKTPETQNQQNDHAERLDYALDTIGEIGRIFVSETDFTKALENALRSIMGVIAVSKGALFIHRESWSILTCSVVRGMRQQHADIPVNASIKKYLIQAQQALQIQKNKNKWLAQLAKQLSPLNPKVIIPLVANQALQGLLVLGDRFLKQPYTPEDLHLLWTIAPHFASGLYNQHLIAESQQANFQLNRKVVELETLYDATLTLNSSLHIEDIVEEILLLSVGVVDARAGCLLLCNERTGRMHVTHQIGLDQHLQWHTLRPKFYQALKAGRVVALQNKKRTTASGFTHGLVAPLGDAGILAVFDKESRQGIQPFTDADIRLLELMGQQAGAALANARLYNNILEVKTYNENILSSIGNGVISTDLKGRIVQINPAVERVFDTVPIGKSCAQFFKKMGCTQIAFAIQSALKDGKSQQIDGEVIADRNITLNARIEALRNETEDVQGLVIALEDLSAEMRIRDRFKQYASDQVVDLLLKQKTPPTLGGEKRQVTILFADIRGSTALLGRIGAEEMVAVLNRCFSRLNEIIFRYNGTLDKYTGDGFLVVYGAPVAFPDDAERAVRTALDMREEMMRIHKETGDTLGLGLGLAQGEVIAGNIGSVRRMEYTVIGESVNLAARLCDGARAGQIWAGKNIYEKLKHQFDFEHLGLRRFKNVDPIDVYEVLGTKGARRKQPKSTGGHMAEEKKTPKIVDLTIPTLPEMELTATKTAEAVAQFAGLSQDKLEEVKMALIEACINAIEHSQSKDHRVSINFAIGDNDLTIQISDTGQGFDPEAARQKVVERRARGETKRGWGLQIMSELMDHVDIRSDENGTVITMMKKR